MRKFWSVSQTGNSAAPSGSTTIDGSIDLTAFPGPADDYTVVIASTAGSATMTVVARLWLYMEGATDPNDPTTLVGYWCPAGTGTAADKGKLNEGAAIEETSADTLRHVERLYGMRDAKRAYIQFLSIGGTDTAVQAYLTRRGGQR